MTLTTSSADVLATRVLQRLGDAGLVPRPQDSFDWTPFHEFRTRVRATFHVPGTTITPLMARVLFGIGALGRPSSIVCIGSYAGNALVWLAGPALTANASTRLDRCLGLDTDAEATALARANFAALGASTQVELLCADGHALPDLDAEPFDLIMLDADDPVTRKAIYQSLLVRCYPALAEGGLLLAHDICVPKFADDMRRYQALVSDPLRFERTLSLAIDDCGLEVSVKRRVSRRLRRSCSAA